MPETTAQYATGKRKTAIARVWLSAGSGQVTVNDRPADQYFERETSIMVMKQALELIEAADQFEVWATVKGGGHSAQAEAMRHGISRALTRYDEELRKLLKPAKLLTRDAREKERKKVGLKRARKAPQYTKR
jgi:small subunit ribosomal protein S9